MASVLGDMCGLLQETAILTTLAPAGKESAPKAAKSEINIMRIRQATD